IGEVEGVWEQLIQDHTQGGLQKYYHCPNPSLERHIEKEHKRSKRFLNVQSIMTTKGCPYRCSFCTVSDIYGEKIRHVPIENVIKDIEKMKVNSNYFMILDDNVIGDINYARQLFKAISPYKIKWVGQSSISIAYDSELLKLAKESGCLALFIGIESISKGQMESLKKSPKDMAKIEECIKKIKDRGIFFYPSFVFGFDTDTKAIFEETYEFVLKNNINIAAYLVLTPHPGTKIFEQFKNERRLLTVNWKYYDHNTVVFKPKNMTPYELQEGYQRFYKEVTKIPLMLQRCGENIKNPIKALGILLWHLSNRKWLKEKGQDKLERIKTGKFDQPYCSTLSLGV
ncbi:MAG: radical SAM protein, partial [Elusimicrobia bacterium]|nr:radical SAM protein [Elusimicrobiota bacterium]